MSSKWKSIDCNAPCNAAGIAATVGLLVQIADDNEVFALLLRVIFQFFLLIF